MSINRIHSGYRVKGEKDCPDCRGTGLIPPPTKNNFFELCRCGGPAKGLEEMCEVLVRKVKRIQPDWAENMERTRDERHWTYTQLLSACMAYVYERGLHMTIPKHDFWKEGEEEPEVVRCAWEDCSKEFKRAFPGEKFCSQLCGQLAMSPKKAVRPVVEVTQEEAKQIWPEETPFPIHDEHDQLADG